MTCWRCGTVNAEGRRFCLECGAALNDGCPVCGAANEPGAKFCGTCGSRLVAGPAAAAVPAGGSRPAGVPASGSAAAGPTGSAPAEPAGPVAERRHVSVLFADLVGFTTLSAERDPEAVRELLGRYFERCREIIDRYGGVVEKFIGDAVMAVWGTPVTREDDAERAVRAALELVDAIPALGREADIPLQVRAGVLTGEAAVTIGARDQGMVAGDLVNTASRLQSVAQPGTVLVGEATRIAAEKAVAFEAAGEQELKGKAAPVPAWRALRVIGDRGGGGRPDGLEPPFVGRAEELRFLKEQFHATGRERRARLVSLVGQGGIGKSRLAWELEKYLDGVVETFWWHRGRSPSYGEGVTFWALGEMVRRRAGLVEGADEAATRKAVDAMLLAHVQSAEERAWIAPRVLVLLGIGETPAGGREELFAAWRTFFERLAASRTVALVFEDLQWADDGLLDFLEHLLDWARTHPIFVLTLSRPELLERRPGWGSDRRGAISMRLEALGPTAMRELLDGLVPGLPEGVVARILERADGIPLYAVETVRMLVAKGSLAVRDGRLAVAGDLGDLDVPPTLRALVGARLDALPPADRALLEDAAVLGQSFTLPALVALTEEPEATLVPRLAALVRREILTIETDPRAPTRGQHAFVQALLREVAYGTLSRRDRRTRHLAAARYFDGLGDDELAGVIATHYLAAYRAAPEGPDGEAVAGQARAALLASADRAEALGALGQATTLLRQAGEVTPDAAGRAALLLRVGYLETVAGRFDDAALTLEGALAAFEELGDDEGRVAAAGTLMHAHLSASRIDRSVEVFERMAPMARALEGRASSAGALAGYWEAAANTEFRLGHFDEAIRQADLAIALAEPIELHEPVVMAIITKGTSMTASGRRREGIALLRGVVEDAREHRLNTPMVRAMVNLAGSTGAPDPTGSLALTRQTIEVVRRLGMRGFDLYLAGNASNAVLTGEWAWLRAYLTSLLDEDPDRAEAGFIRTLLAGMDVWADGADEAVLQANADLSRASGDFQGVVNTATALAELSYARGDLATALARYEALDITTPGWSVSASPLQYALQLGDVAAVERLEARFEAEGPATGPLDRRLVAAVRAAIQGREAEAADGFRATMGRARELGLRWSLAMTALAMAEVLPGSLPAVAEAAGEARAIAAELGATQFLRRLDRALART